MALKSNCQTTLETEVRGEPDTARPQPALFYASYCFPDPGQIEQERSSSVSGPLLPKLLPLACPYLLLCRLEPSEPPII